MKLQKITLYGVRSVNITAVAGTDAEAEVDVVIEAPADIEVDLLAAALTLRGFTNDQVLKFRNLLREPDLRAKLEALMQGPPVEALPRKDRKSVV